MKFVLNYTPNADHLAALQRVAPSAEFCIATSEAEAQALVVDADAMLGNRYFLQSLPFARQLRWMQSNSMGVDLHLTAAGLLDNVMITCARHVYDDEVADHALALLLALTRGIHTARDQQHRQEWNREPLITLRGSRAVMLGWGGIGQAISQRLISFGVSIAGVRLRHSGDPAHVSDHITLHGPDTWRAELPLAHFLIIAVPMTSHTHHLIDQRVFAALRAGAYLINVARGGIVDEVALLAAVRSGRLAGAGLDVLETEPPPPDHPFWAEPSILLTPHVARSPESPPYRWEPLFVENVRRFYHSEPLLHVVDKARGY